MNATTRYIWLSYITAAVWLLFAAQYAILGRPWNMGIDLAVTAATVVNYLWARRREQRIAVAGHLLLGFSLIGIAAAACVSGQASALGLWYLASIPLAAAYVCSIRGVLGWAIAAAGATVLVHLGGSWRPLPAEFVPGTAEVLITQLVLIFTVVIITMVIRRDQNEHVESLGRRLIRALEERDTSAAHNHLVRNIVNTMPGGMMVADATGTVIIVNDRACDMFDLSPSTVSGLKLEQVVRNFLRRRMVTPRAFAETVGQLLTQDHAVAELEFDDGRVIELASLRLGDELRLDGFVWEFRDVSARVHKERDLEETIKRDELTGLASRSHFEELLDESCRLGKPFAVAFIDFDNFKDVNDQFGHESGDEFLRVAAQRMQSCLRDGDTVARIGGDEFAALLPGASPQRSPRSTLDRLIVELASPVDTAGTAVASSASVGVAFFPTSGRTSDELLRHSDELMYDAKNAGKNRVVFAGSEPDVPHVNPDGCHTV